MFMLSGVATASAQAECPDAVPGEDVALCKNGVEQEGLFPFLSFKTPNTSSKLEVEAGPSITCQEALDHGTIHASNSSLLILLLLKFHGECLVTNTAETKANCEVAEPISTNEIHGSFDGDNPLLILFRPLTGNVFANVTINNKPGKTCIFKIAGAKVTGEQDCHWMDPESLLVLHLLLCPPGGSKLEFAGKKAFFELTEEVHLGPPFLGQTWGFYLS
ncbi:MAG TPA: hypothetical protein VNY27_06480 [Solirubrobacteraceae bacterium]|jgi:hypothetical protein|nr:hypothetical protein [Solirubrobacteraceae bacterium]